MRIKLKDRHEVAHFWANKVQDQGECGNVFFRDSTIFSYGTHFAIARHLSDGSIAFTSRDYSPSTSSHMMLVRQAIHHGTKLHYVPYPDDGIAHNREAVDKRIKQRLELAAKRRIAKTRDGDLASAVHIAEQFNGFALALGAKKKDLIKTEALVGLDLDKLKAKLKRDEDAKERAAKALQKKREAEMVVSRDSWRRGERHGYFSGQSIMLRLREAVDGPSEGRVVAIETSAGAEIPLDASLRLWPIILRCMSGDKDYEVGMELGHYRLTKIRTDGSIVVGCHDIAFSEIEGIAKQLGLLEAVSA